MVDKPDGYISREEIFTALFDAFRNSYAYRTAERKLVLWTESQRENRPALYQVERLENHINKDVDTPTIRWANVQLWIYTDATSSDVPASLLNPLLDAVEWVLHQNRNQLTGRITLGGIVTQVRINGDVFKDPGDIDGDGMLIIPLQVLLP